MRVQQKMKRRIPRSVLVAVFMLGVLGLSVAGYTETYNFYFEKKKTEAKDDEEKAPVPAPTPAVAAAPIVINNTNNVGTPSAVTTNNSGVLTAPGVVAPSPTLIAPAPQAVTEVAQSRAPVTRPERSAWRMALTGMMFLREYQRSYIYQGEKSSYKDLEKNMGGLLSLGYNFSRSFAVNLYGGMRVEPQSDDSKIAHLGVDLELMPFRLPVSDRHDLIELGFLFGGSTAMASRQNSASLHAGMRLNINIVPEFGITTSARANLGYVLFEGGIVARL